MFGWLRSLFRGKPKEGFAKPSRPVHRFVWPIIDIPKFEQSGDPPPMHWKACHPSTVKRFKAEMTCSEGHGLVLKGHTVAVDGRVSPSVVCRAPGCSFHAFVRLAGWTFGNVV